MQYGHFDDEQREYVMDRVDLPASWTNYLGVERMCAVVNHTAGGYLFCGSAENHRITKFRGNGVPMDSPGFYTYLRDNSDGDFWSVSWQPVGKPLTAARYKARHGLSYSVYECDYRDIHAVQKMAVPLGEDVLLWDVTLENTGDEPKDISLFPYCEFSFHQVQSDNQNFQMSLYCTGTEVKNGIILYDLHYEEEAYQFFTSNEDMDGFDTMRDSFLGTYGSEKAPEAVVKGETSQSVELTGNHCAAFMKRLTLQPGEKKRIIFLLGEGGEIEGTRLRKKYQDPAAADFEYGRLKEYWEAKIRKQTVHTPDKDMNTMLNIWNLYQAEVNITFSRFASFIEVGGRTGLGYRDTAQDAMTIPHSNPARCRQRIMELLSGLTSTGYGIHLFEPAWFAPRDPKAKKPFKSPTVIPDRDASSYVHGLEDACSDDALWLVPAIVEYIRETGDTGLIAERVGFADGGEASVYEHMKRILDFSDKETGADGICLGLRADWNDCLNLGGGESAMVSFLHVWALGHFVALAEFLGRSDDADYYRSMQERVKKNCEKVLWDGSWYLRGFTASGRKIGSHENAQGKIFLESNAWAVLSGAASPARADETLEAIEKYLYTPYGIRLNYPSFTEPDDELGFIGRVYPGVKENGSVFSHPNPWVWAAECTRGHGNRAYKYYSALCPAKQNDAIEVRESEPYSYCQFIMGPDHTAFGRARHPFMTGSGGWAYFSATRYMLGIRPDFDELVIDPCIPDTWDGFDVSRIWRGATYKIHVANPEHVEHGVKKLKLDGNVVERIPAFPAGEVHEVDVVMG